MAFFCLQAPLLLAEAWLQRLGRQAHIRLPLPVRTAATLLALHCREWRCPPAMPATLQALAPAAASPRSHQVLRIMDASQLTSS